MWVPGGSSSVCRVADSRERECGQAALALAGPSSDGLIWDAGYRIRKVRGVRALPWQIYAATAGANV